MTGSAAPVGLKAGSRSAESSRVTSGPAARTHDDAATTGLPLVGAGLAGLYAGLLPVHVLVPADLRVVLVAADAGAGAFVAAVAWLAARRHLPGWRRQTATAAVVLTVPVVAALDVLLTGRLWAVSMALVALVLAAALVAARRLWLGVTLVTWLAWGLALTSTLVRRPPTTELVGTGVSLTLAMAATSVVALAVRAGREGMAAALVTARRVVDEQSVRDPLTGLANRRGLALAGVPMIENARRQGQAVHCLVVDVDGFRAVNEALGHSRGDEVLVAVAEAMREATRSTDVVARWSGDEFVVLGPGTGTSPLEMERRVRAHLGAAGAAGAVTVPREVWSGRVSAGSATLVPWDDGDLDALLNRADQDMSLRRSLRRRATPAAAAPAPARPLTPEH